MPNPTLTPDQIKRILATLTSAEHASSGSSLIDGRYYAGNYAPGTYSGADNYSGDQMTGFYGYDPIAGASGNESVYNGKTATRFDSQGNYIGDGTFTNVSDWNPNADLAKFAATAAALYGAGNFINGQLGVTPGQSAGSPSYGGADAPAPTEGGSGIDTATSAPRTGLGSGTGDYGLGDITNTGMVNSPIADPNAVTLANGAASAPLPMGPGGWAAATAPAQGSTAATSMAFDPALGAAAAAVPSVFRPSVDSASANAGPTDPNAPTGVNPGGGATDWAKWLSDNRSVLQALGLGAGAVMGATPTTTEKKTVAAMDPRMDAYVYGDGTGANPAGLLGRASDWYSQNSSGINPTMRQALDQKKGLLTDPNTTAGYQNIARVGQGLLGTQMAANPYANGRPQTPSLLDTYGRRVRRNPDGSVSQG